jgi:ribosomal protein L14
VENEISSNTGATKVEMINVAIGEWHKKHVMLLQVATAGRVLQVFVSEANKHQWHKSM